MNYLVKCITTLVFLVLSVISVNGKPLEIGAKAPELKGVDQDGKTVDLGELYKKGITLVFFYPKANTGGCRNQVCSVRDAFETLKEKGVNVVGVSMDEQADQKRFHSDNSLPYPLIADTDGKIVAAFGVPRRGKVSARQAFLVQDGKIIWRDLQASTAKQAEDVLQAISPSTAED